MQSLPTLNEVYTLAKPRALRVLKKYRVSDSRLSADDLIAEMLTLWIRYGFLDDRGELVGFDPERSRIEGWVSMCLERTMMRWCRKTSDKTASRSLSLDEPLSEDSDNSLADRLPGATGNEVLGGLLLREVRSQILAELGAELPSEDQTEIMDALDRLDALLHIRVETLTAAELRSLAHRAETIQVGPLTAIMAGGRQLKANMLTALRLVAEGWTVTELAEAFHVRCQTVSWRFSCLQARLDHSVV